MGSTEEKRACLEESHIVLACRMDYKWIHLKILKVFKELYQLQLKKIETAQNRKRTLDPQTSMGRQETGWEKDSILSMGCSVWKRKPGSEGQTQSPKPRAWSHRDSLPSCGTEPQTGN